jgi:hypothetical protein
MHVPGKTMKIKRVQAQLTLDKAHGIRLGCRYKQVRLLRVISGKIFPQKGNARTGLGFLQREHRDY